MNQMLKIDTLEKVNFAQISAVFNAAFADYFLPAKLTEAQLKDKFLIEGGCNSKSQRKAFDLKNV